MPDTTDPLAHIRARLVPTPLTVGVVAAFLIAMHPDIDESTDREWWDDAALWVLGTVASHE